MYQFAEPMYIASGIGVVSMTILANVDRHYECASPLSQADSNIAMQNIVMSLGLSKALPIPDVINFLRMS